MNAPPTGIIVIPGTDYWVVENDTHLSAWALEHGDVVSDPHLMKFLWPYVQDAKVAFDIGANIGSHAVQYSRRWGMYTVAIEPHPVSFACLQHNASDALCLNFAASNVEGTVNLMSNENLGASKVHPEGEWSVPCMALDDNPDLPAPDYVKIDVEGWEPNVILGMAGIITRHKPILFVEMNRGCLEANGFTVEGLDDQIRALGYRSAILYPPAAKWSDPQFDCLYLPQP